METRTKKKAMAIQTRSRRPVVTPARSPVKRVTRNRSKDPAASAPPAAAMKVASKNKRQPKESKDPPETKKDSPRKEQVEPVAGSSKTVTRATRSRREPSVEPKPLVTRKRKAVAETQASAEQDVAPKLRKRGAASKDSGQVSKEEEKPRNTRLRGKKIPPEVGDPENKRQKAKEVVLEKVKRAPRGKKKPPEVSKVTAEVPKEEKIPPLRKLRERGEKNPPEPLRTLAKAPLQEHKVTEEQGNEAKEQEETESDKENENVSKNEQSPTNTSGEKKPIYKIINTVATQVPMDQLIVMSEEAEPTDGVYEFESSQNSNGNGVKKKPRKRATPKSSKPAPKQPKFWDPKKLRKFQQKSAAEARAAKLLSIPTHILEKVKEKEKIKRQSLHVSTPVRKPSPRMNMDDDVFSPIVQKENPLPETNVDDTEVFEDSLPEPHTDTPEPEAPQADLQPWRTDQSILLPSTSYVKQSERDFLPSYSSEMIVKATPKKPKPSPKVIKTPKTADPAPQTTPKTAEYTLTNYFGFDNDDTLEVNEEIAKKHGEEALQKERQRLKALAPLRKTPAAPSSRRDKIKTLQQLTIKEAIPSTSKDPPRTQVVENLFEPQRPEMRRSYSRPRSTSKVPDSEDEEEQKVEIKKKRVKEYEGKPKKALSKKDKKHEEELNKFCTSFNEMCDEVEEFDVIVE